MANLIKAADENPDELIPHASDGLVETWQEQIEELEALLEKLKHRRDQFIAHLDADPTEGPNPLKGEMDGFVEVVRSLDNDIQGASKRASAYWDNVLRNSESSTSEIMRILAEYA